MEDDGDLNALQALHKNLSNTTEALRADREFEVRNGLLLRFLETSGALLDDLSPKFRALLEKPGRRKESRDAVLSGKAVLSGEEYTLNKDFQELTLQIADSLELDEIDAAKLALATQHDDIALGRSWKECAIIRFHQQRSFLLNCMLLLLELAKEEDELVAEDVGENIGSLGSLSRYVSENILRENLPGITNSPSQPRFVPACVSTMGDIRMWLQKLAEQVASASVLGVASEAQFQETVELTYVSLVQQHELLSVILCYAIEKHVAIENDFIDFLRILKQATRYDSCTVHLVPVLGTYISIFGSTEGSGSVEQARKLNRIVCQQSEDEARSMPFLNAAVRAWWIAEYSGWYMDDAAGSGLSGIDIDEEDKQRSRLFAEALRDGAFDFMLAVIADVKASEWEDAARKSLRQWLRKRTPPLSTDTLPFSEPFQARLAAKLETFVDAFISNMPDVLRRLKIEEDEQRQTSQGQEQDYDLERFLLIIAYSFEGRPEAADGFWGDPENNLAGFLQWASRRATTPVQAAFCEMLQSLSEDEPSAKSAHEFLLDEGHQIRKPLTITWAHIIHELEYFANKIREKPAATQVSMNRAGKVNPEQAETEPEFAAMLESYLRLMAKLTSQSEAARKYLFEQPHLLSILFQVVSSLVTPRIRACTFRALSSLLSRKTVEQNDILWEYLEACLSGRFFLSTNRAGSSSSAQPPSFYMEGLFQEMSPHADDAIAFIQFLATLTSLPQESSSLRDVLPYPKDLGASTRMRSGIEPYIDFALGHMFSIRAQDVPESVQQRMLRLCCLDLALTCVSNFNEDLIIFSNETNVNVDAAIKCDSLENYVTLHPFARVMEWMYDAKFMKGILETIHQNPADIGKAAPDSPLILSVLRAIELVSKALDLQATYINLVRPIVKPQSRTQGRSAYIPVSNGAFGSIEDGLMVSMALMSDLGSYCGIGHPELTLASLKLLEKISASPRVISVWQSGSSNLTHRNKAIMALEEHDDAATIAGSFITEFHTPLDLFKESESPEYQIKLYILDFIHSCMQASPDRPTIAHLLLGFRCGANTVEIEPGSPFDEGKSLFHALLPVIIDVKATNEEGSMITWLVNFRYKVMRILKLLWSSPLSSRTVLEELRANEFLFHILVQGLVVQQNLLWDGVEASGPDFLTYPAAGGYVDFLSMRAMALEYVTRELCSVSLGHTPALKRRIFDALGGQIKVDSQGVISVPSAFEFQDSLSQESQFETAPPDFKIVGELDLSSCLEEDDDQNRIYNLNKVQEILLLRFNETGRPGQLILQEDLELMETEKDMLLQYLRYLNRFTQIRAYSHKVLAAWTRLLMVMTNCNEFKGTNKVSFILQTLQAMLPSLEMYGSDNPSAALELAKLAKVLLFELDFETMTSTDKQSRAVENLISDKLFQLLQVCLSAIAKWAGNQELRAVYYSICYRHLTGLVDHGHGVSSSLRKTTKTIQAFGEKLLNVVCDDAFGGDAACQSAALILLGTLVQLGKQENDNFVVETLNRLNFIGILVDSLRDVLAEWEVVSRTGDSDQQNYIDAKLALLLQLCQTREGAKNVLHANLFRAIEQSGLFSVDPELQVDSADSRALERHYDLLVKVARIIGAAIVSRGSHNVLQGRRFLTEHRMLVMHVLKRSAGIGAGAGKTDTLLSERVSDLAEAFMVVITATGFLEFEGGNLQEDKRPAPMLFH
ncbi:nucleoporin Nup186/Nup192/Nup205 [Annulohypoxylon maeteangense]|uniref:nucleoporin Nup186/Nup192/Nup205 n=1 Tax=Annulohypoxylon maeteangense TaxID=1927788 RepID=UPI002008CA28|nr:nucleoporin Nup186/Nup192/Nup205 [Annulohypoxylon maeteangense]KAI0887191.1 nucleoporin Nup186/Nup192/Nup205 [Annulohypoxylon maeteangense]